MEIKINSLLSFELGLRSARSSVERRKDSWLFIGILIGLLILLFATAWYIANL